MSNKNHYVYLFTNVVNNRKYLGVRSCHCPIKDDGYVGSASSSDYWADRKVHEFSREVLGTFATRKEAEAFEKAELSSRMASQCKSYYNLRNDGWPESAACLGGKAGQVTLRAQGTGLYDPLVRAKGHAALKAQGKGFHDPKIQSMGGKAGGSKGGKAAAITNRTNGTGAFFDRKIQSKGGKASAAQQKANGTGLFDQKNRSKAGKVSQQRRKERGLNAYNQTPEEHRRVCIKGGCKGGKISGKAIGPLFGKRSAKDFVFRSPDGTIYYGKSITAFAREMNLPPQTLIAIFRCQYTAKQGKCKGWSGMPLCTQYDIHWFDKELKEIETAFANRKQLNASAA